MGWWNLKSQYKNIILSWVVKQDAFGGPAAAVYSSPLHLQMKIFNQGEGVSQRVNPFPYQLKDILKAV